MCGVVWWRFGQAKMEEGGSFCLRAVGFLNSFSRTAPANSMVVSSGVWFGGGLGKQRWKRELLLLSEGCGGELLSEGSVWEFIRRELLWFSFFILCFRLFGEGFK